MYSCNPLFWDSAWGSRRTGHRHSMAPIVDAYFVYYILNYCMFLMCRVNNKYTDGIGKTVTPALLSARQILLTIISRIIIPVIRDDLVKVEWI